MEGAGRNNTPKINIDAKELVCYSATKTYHPCKWCLLFVVRWGALRYFTPGGRGPTISTLPDEDGTAMPTILQSVPSLLQKNGAAVLVWTRVLD